MNVAVGAAIRSFLISQLLGIWSMTVAAVGIGWSLGPNNGGFNDWPTFVQFLSHAWFGIMLGVFFGIGPYFRAKQGSDAATKALKGSDRPAGAT